MIGGIHPTLRTIMRITLSRFGQVQRQYRARLKAQVEKQDHI